MLKHISKCFVTGLVVVLPVAGTILVLGYLESTISSSGISKLPFYFPGLGLLLTCLVIYFLGLITTTLAGQWLWGRADQIFRKMPAIGKIYISLKQILGYGEGKDAMFQEVVEVGSSSGQGIEIGLITNRFQDSQGNSKIVVFIPSAPNPTSGRMVILAPEQVKPSTMSVHDALKTLVTIGKAEAGLESGSAR